MGTIALKYCGTATRAAQQLSHTQDKIQTVRTCEMCVSM